jgi:hypothetical protein
MTKVNSSKILVYYISQSDRQTDEQIDRWTNREKELLPDMEAYFGKKFHNLREKWNQLEQEGCQMQSDWYSESDSQLKICKSCY